MTTLFLWEYLNSDFFIKYYIENGPKKGKRILFNQKILQNFTVPNFSNKIKEDIAIASEYIYKNKSMDFEIINQIIKSKYIIS